MGKGAGREREWSASASRILSFLLLTNSFPLNSGEVSPPPPKRIMTVSAFTEQ